MPATLKDFLNILLRFDDLLLDLKEQSHADALTDTKNKTWVESKNIFSDTRFYT